jgi:metal-responsive CopG/Arc/MetJ family transcriptional regulator
MAKDNLKLISVRIDPDTLQKIDEMAKRHYYWKRNTFINGILQAVIQGFDEKDIVDMVKYHPKWYVVEVAQFKCKK